jgi:hypothetical protein
LAELGQKRRFRPPTLSRVAEVNVGFSMGHEGEENELPI